MINYRSVSCILLLCLAIITPAQWTKLPGPYGGKVAEIAACGDYLFAATEYGLFRTSLTVTHWENFGPFPSQSYSNIISVAVSGSTVFAATSGRLFRSTDFGAQWTAIAIGDNGHHQIKKMCAQEHYVFAATDRWDNGEYLDYVNWMKATDTILSTTLGPMSEYIMTMDVRDSVVVVGCDRAMFVSQDAGTSWMRHSGMSSSHIYAVGTYDSTLLMGDMSGFYASDMDSSNWTAAFAPFKTTSVQSLCISSNAILVGRFTKAGNSIARSFDRGVTWDTLCSGLPMSTCVSSLKKVGNSYYAGTNYGVFRSDDDGASWTEMNEGLPCSAVSALESFNGAIFAGTPDAGVSVSYDNGNSWTSIRKGLSVPHVNCLKGTENYLFAGIDAGGVHILDKRIDSWLTPNNSAIQKTWCTTKMAVNNNVIFALTKGLGLVCAEPSSWPSWGNCSGFNTTGLAYAVAAFGSGVICWSDAGLFRCNPIAPERPGVVICGTILRDSLSPGRFVSFAVQDDLLFGATAYHGVFVSSDSGQTWDSVNTGLVNQARYMYALLLAGNGLFAASLKGIYLSTNHGSEWISTGGGDLDSALVQSLLIDGNYLYAGTYGLGLWRRPLDQMVAVGREQIPVQRLNGRFRAYSVNKCIRITTFEPEQVPLQMAIYTLEGRKIDNVLGRKRTTGDNGITFGPVTPGGYICRAVVQGRIICQVVCVY